MPQPEWVLLMQRSTELEFARIQREWWFDMPFNVGPLCESRHKLGVNKVAGLSSDLRYRRACFDIKVWGDFSHEASNY